MFAIFNSLGTEQNEAIRPYLNQKQVPQLFVATGATEFGRDYRQYPWTIAYQPTYISEGAMYGTYIRRTMPRAKIAILYQNDSYGADLIAGLQRGLGPKKGNIVSKVGYSATDDNVQSEIAQLRGSKAGILMLFATPKFVDPGLPVREQPRLEAEDLRQRRLERVERDGALLEPRPEQARRGLDLDRLPQGSRTTRSGSATRPSCSTARS